MKYLEPDIIIEKAQMKKVAKIVKLAEEWNITTEFIISACNKA
jgi:hypothetical protein